MHSVFGHLSRKGNRSGSLQCNEVLLCLIEGASIQPTFAEQPHAAIAIVLVKMAAQEALGEAAFTSTGRYRVVWTPQCYNLEGW